MSEAIIYLLVILSILLPWAIYDSYKNKKRRKKKKSKNEYCLIDFAGGRVNLK